MEISYSVNALEFVKGGKEEWYEVKLIPQRKPQLPLRIEADAVTEYEGGIATILLPAVRRYWDGGRRELIKIE